MAIPFILAPMVTATIYYVANSLNFIKPIIAQVPWPTPVGIGAFSVSYTHLTLPTKLEV
ncbi:hypothetical protein PVA38_11420 [Streptococcus pneumoniae D39]|nr:hypothetical protein PVA38_11420 [Streptococcus pneumoniae D39]